MKLSQVPTLKRLEMYENSVDNLILTIVIKFRFNTLLFFFPNITVKYHFAAVSQYFPAMCCQKINGKLFNRNLITMVKIRLFAEFP